MHYLIDAYNLLFCMRIKRGSLEKSRQALIEEINEIISALNLNVTLVFDGAEKHFSHSSRGHFDAVELVFTPKSQTADEYIIEEVSNSKSPTQVTVVTNDNELSGRCHLLKAKTQSIDAFLAFLQKKKSKKKKLPTKAIRTFQESNTEFNRLLAIFEKKLKDYLDK